MKKLLLTLPLLILVLVGGVWIYYRTCDWNPQKAAAFATEHAEKKSVSLCAMYIRKAMMAGGIPIYWGGNACHYKYILPFLGFEKVEDDKAHEVGDIVVFQPIGNRKYGHIAIWNGKQWVSDFKQQNIIVHSDYRKEGCEYAIYRRNF